MRLVIHGNWKFSSLQDVSGYYDSLIEIKLRYLGVEFLVLLGLVNFCERLAQEIGEQSLELTL